MPHPVLANVGKASKCHTEREKNKKVREIATCTVANIPHRVKKVFLLKRCS
jgi:hypothetical protein